MGEVAPTLDELIRSRTIPKSRLYRSWCRHCKELMRTDVDGLKAEIEGKGPYCSDCTDGGWHGSYGGSPQEAKDRSYHGGQFHTGEW